MRRPTEDLTERFWAEALLEWCFWSLIFGLVVGGIPWIFPSGGKHVFSDYASSSATR